MDVGLRTACIPSLRFQQAPRHLPNLVGCEVQRHGSRIKLMHAKVFRLAHQQSGKPFAGHLDITASAQVKVQQIRVELLRDEHRVLSLCITSAKLLDA